MTEYLHRPTKKEKKIGEIHNPWTRKLPFLAADQIGPAGRPTLTPLSGRIRCRLNPFFAKPGVLAYSALGLVLFVFFFGE